MENSNRNDDPLYINKHSNHPPNIIRQQPNSMDKLISLLSSEIRHLRNQHAFTKIRSNLTIHSRVHTRNTFKERHINHIKSFQNKSIAMTLNFRNIFGN